MHYYIIQTNSGELYHHGILGQKWGHRQGPPYPLGSGDHSASEKRAGWRKSLSVVQKVAKTAKSVNADLERGKQGPGTNKPPKGAIVDGPRNSAPPKNAMVDGPNSRKVEIRLKTNKYQNADGSLTEKGRAKYLTKEGNALNEKGVKEFMKIDKKVGKAFIKSDKQNFNSVNAEMNKKHAELVTKAIDDVKKHDPSIGAVVIMSDGRAYTSRNYKDALKKGLTIKKVNWVCYGNTLTDTLNMIATTTKYGNEKAINDLSNEYKTKRLEAVFKDAGAEEIYKGNELVKRYLNGNLKGGV